METGWFAFVSTARDLVTRPGRSLVQDGICDVELSFVFFGVEVIELLPVEGVLLVAEDLLAIDLVFIARLDDLVVGLLTFVTANISVKQRF